MTPTKNNISDGTKKLAEPIFHLVHATSGGKPLCGDPSPDALIGSYVEHLDGTTAENTQWVREIFDRSGKAVSPCPICLSIYPPVLLDVVPFDITINLHFKPNRALSGYDVTTISSAQVGAVRRNIDALPALSYFSARWLGSLRFALDVDANPIVPLVEHANKAKQ